MQPGGLAQRLRPLCDPQASCSLCAQCREWGTWHLTHGNQTLSPRMWRSGSNTVFKSCGKIHVMESLPFETILCSGTQYIHNVVLPPLPATSGTFLSPQMETPCH